MTASIPLSHNFKLGSSKSKDCLKEITSRSSSDHKIKPVKPYSLKMIQKVVKVGRKIPHLSASAQSLVKKMSKPLSAELISVKTEESSVAEEMPFGAEE